jgi:hypothetical protein
MDVQRAFRTARIWNQGGSESALGILWDRGGLISDRHRLQLQTEVEHEIQWCRRAIKTGERDRSGSAYCETDIEDLQCLLEVVQTAQVGDELMPSYRRVSDEEINCAEKSWGAKEEPCDCPECTEAKMPAAVEAQKILNYMASELQGQAKEARKITDELLEKLKGQPITAETLAKFKGPQITDELLEKLKEEIDD